MPLNINPMIETFIKRVVNVVIDLIVTMALLIGGVIFIQVAYDLLIEAHPALMISFILVVCVALSLWMSYIFSSK